MQASPTQGGPIVWILQREGIVSGKICEVVRGHNSYSFPAERLSEWITDPYQ